MKKAITCNQLHPAGSKFELVVAYLTLIIPCLSFCFALVLLPKPGWFEFCLFFLFYILSLLGITLGYHRLFTHRSFTAPLWFEYFIGVCAGMAAQGSLFFWAGVHRHHHLTSDTNADIHSPIPNLKKSNNKFKSFCNAHMFWMLNSVDISFMGLIKDLLKRKKLYLLNQYYLAWVFLGILLPGLISAYHYHTWQGFILGLVWGGLIRIFIGHHVTWSINSVCHLWGTRDFDTEDNSTNNALFGILALGEGWHNNHHAFPYSARHGLKWWQFDITYIVIYLLAKTNLIREVKLPLKDNLSKSSKIKSRF